MYLVSVDAKDRSIVTKNLQVPSVMMEIFCKNKQNDHHKGLDVTHQIIHRFKIFKSILV